MEVAMEEIQGTQIDEKKPKETLEKPKAGVPGKDNKQRQDSPGQRHEPEKDDRGD
jgi:hypothetical protein